MPKTISLDSLRAELDSRQPPTLVEALGADYYADAHLPGAVNLPPHDVDRLAPRVLPDRQARIVVYCSGTCDSSHIVARRLEQLGYSDISIYEGGKEEWVEHGLPVVRSADDT
ncbi:MAG TPA: rhodanese-like domain-containing protein [Acidimicrobiales bacterium]|nr:rhodanese-like domain-containing protein [Acidimicrobiales bacterium]